MPDSALLQIMDALVAISRAVPSIGSTGLLVDVGRLWQQEERFPACYLGDDGEDSQDGPTQSVEGQPASLFFYTAVRGESATRLFHTLYKELKDRVDADPTLGGLCFRAKVSGYLALNTASNVAARTHVARVNVDVHYRRPRGNA
jgi:hypothetical protein